MLDYLREMNQMTLTEDGSDASKQLGGCQARVGILRSLSCHRQAALDQHAKSFGRQIGRRDRGRTRAAKGEHALRAWHDRRALVPDPDRGGADPCTGSNMDVRPG